VGEIPAKHQPPEEDTTMSKNNDRIVYVARKNDTITSADFDEKKLQTNESLSEFYSPGTPERPYNRPEFDTIVVKPSDVLRDIKYKLSPVELLILQTYGGKL